MGLHEWTISDKDSSGNLEERGKGEYKRLRASLQFTTSTEVKNMADMSDWGWDAARITDLYLTRRPARVRIENLHRGWMTAGGEVESLDRFLARLIADGQKLAADRKPPTLMAEVDKPVIGRNSATQDGSDINEELIHQASLTQS